YKEESEPLGQRIEPVDPSPGYPNEYSEITDIASQPEWNCAIMKEFSGGFFNMPVECQKKEAEMMDFSIAGALRSMEPGNPQRIAADHEAGHKGHGKGTPPTLKPSENLTPEEVAQRRELAATGIFDNEGDDAPDDPSLDPPEDTWDFLRWELSVILPLLRDKVKFVGFTKDQEQILASNLLRTVASKKCVDAFRKAGLSTP